MLLEPASSPEHKSAVGTIAIMIEIAIAAVIGERKGVLEYWDISLVTYYGK